MGCSTYPLSGGDTSCFRPPSFVYQVYILEPMVLTGVWMNFNEALCYIVYVQQCCKNPPDMLVVKATLGFVCNTYLQGPNARKCWSRLCNPAFCGNVFLADCRPDPCNPFQKCCWPLPPCCEVVSPSVCPSRPDCCDGGKVKYPGVRCPVSGECAQPLFQAGAGDYTQTFPSYPPAWYKAGYCGDPTHTRYPPDCYPPNPCPQFCDAAVGDCLGETCAHLAEPPKGVVLPPCAQVGGAHGGCGHPAGGNCGPGASSPCHERPKEPCAEQEDDCLSACVSEVDAQLYGHPSQGKRAYSPANTQGHFRARSPYSPALANSSPALTAPPPSSSAPLPEQQHSAFAHPGTQGQGPGQEPLNIHIHGNVHDPRKGSRSANQGEDNVHVPRGMSVPTPFEDISVPRQSEQASGKAVARSASSSFSFE